MNAASADGLANLALWLAIVCGIIVLEIVAAAYLKIRRERRERIGSIASAAIVEKVIDAMETTERVKLPPPRGVIGRATREALMGLIATISGPMRTRLVGFLENDGYVGRVIGGLQSRNAAARARCCMLLGGMLSPQASDALIGRLRNDLDVNVRMTAAEALAEIGSVPTEILTEASKRGFKSHRLCIAISRMGAAAVPSLLNSLSDTNEAVVRLSLDILSETGCVPDVDPIVALTRHASPEVRGRAVHLLGALGAVDCVPRILDTTSDEVWFVRVRAVKGLQQLGIPDVSDVADRYYSVLRDLLFDEAWWVRHHAAEALAASGVRGHVILADIASREALHAMQVHDLHEGAA